MQAQVGYYTHEIPRLIATAMPIFSFFSNFSFQIIFHGNIANMMSIIPNQAEAKRAKVGCTLSSQQAPGTNGSHVFRSGTHWIQRKRPARPMDMLMEMRMAQTSFFIFPDVSRNKVTAKDVFDMPVEAMANVAPKSPTLIATIS